MEGVMSNASPLKDMAISRGDDYKKVVVRYKECLKNHAAAIGGNATDGCGEFMPNGEEGSLEALVCSACNCHRNFHRKEIECDCPSNCCHRKLILVPHGYTLRSPHGIGNPTAAAADTALNISSREEPPPPMIMSFKGGSIPSETDEKDDGRVARKSRKRFRTKFSQEQKEKMFSFAEKAEWRIQKLDESVVQQFCQEIGIKRRVLKVWMHNNKQRFAKKHSVSSA
ncbi:homeobox protein 31, ZINC FINGER HOMEODOMAIN 4, FLORAL TRANSITION AT THE MERISTEM2 [Hibiscus trionum]|uniref:Homeobox protein 31, ZINC FINGER HOMEODOMAIN 4, FLORAL TRANSITION AT THE MERISTEM2 n=1 Tax=Hibiscus trionum TaxID=183268 RepID=A0A9W7I0D5_HIBTR|nr:homeobox protein 31, ZINC FINGER HOMEODOMAIN 4, FLORAL TRANSITION AT THE MERISTEM2 [Hibiscus trionum]